MKRNYIILVLLTLALFAGGYYFYQQNKAGEQANVWSFVPANAVLVYESDRLSEVWESLENESAGEVLQDLPHWQKLIKYQQLLDSASGVKLKSFLQDRLILSSLHITGNNSFDYIFYLPVQSVKDRNVLKQLKEYFLKDADYQFLVRTYHGQEIEEFKHSGTKGNFSFFVKEGCLIGSFTPFLIEDVIRQLEEENRDKGFRQQHSKLFQLSQTDNDQGNLYINGHKLGASLNLFLKENGVQKAFPFSSKLDLSLNKDGVLLNGYTRPEAGEESAPYLQSLLHEPPQSLGVANMVPLRTAILKFYGFGDGGEWHQKLHELEALPQWLAFLNSFPEAKAFPDLLGKRVALAHVPDPQGQSNQLLYLHTKNGVQASQKLQLLAEEMTLATGDSLFQEEFSGYRITQLNFPEFPEALFGPAFAGFEECFYLQMGDYLVMANTIQELKSMIQDIESDNTWQKSVPLYQFMQKTNQEVNFGLYINSEKVWKEFLSMAEPGWGNYLEQYGPYLRQFNMLALQLSSLDDMFYTNFLLQANPQEVQDLKQLRFTNLHQTSLKAPALSRPMLFVNKLQKNQELLVQDKLNILYLLDGQGNIQKSDSLSAPLVGKVFQLDSRKNGRLEYLAATRDALFLYDHSFSLRKGFPVSVPDGAQLEWANVIDYNGSKMYRILGAATSGHIYMFDVEGNTLEGWQPLRLSGALSAAPGHIRVRGKDIIYAFQQKGSLNMINRKGNSYPGFPVNLKDSIIGGVFIKQGSDFNSTEFTTVTKGGELYRLNLNGKLVHRTQLFKPEINSFFMLVQEHQQSGYLIARQSHNRLSLLNASGNLLFEKDYLGAAHVHIQYFNFGADKELITVTDPVEEFTYLYDIKGNLLNFEPLNSCCPLEVQLEDKNGGYRIYKNFENQVSVLKGEE